MKKTKLVTIILNVISLVLILTGLIMLTLYINYDDLNINKTLINIIEYSGIAIFLISNLTYIIILISTKKIKEKPIEKIPKEKIEKNKTSIIKIINTISKYLAINTTVILISIIGIILTFPLMAITIPCCLLILISLNSYLITKDIKSKE